MVALLGDDDDRCLRRIRDTPGVTLDAIE